MFTWLLIWLIFFSDPPQSPPLPPALCQGPNGVVVVCGTNDRFYPRVYESRTGRVTGERVVR